MLVILSGIVAIRKHYISGEITNVLNNMDRFVIDEYTVDFTKQPFEVYEKDVLVYCPGSDNQPGVATMLEKENSLDTFNKIIAVQEKIYNYPPNEYKDDFNDSGYDLGITSEIHFDNDINKVIDAYNKRDFDTQVILGIFSKEFLNQIRSQLGAENVVVLNILRNPSAAYLFDLSPQSIADDVNFVQLGNRLTASLFNAMVLKSIDYVTTIKFEDIISNGSLVLNGKTVRLPEFVQYNNYITEYEHSIVDTPEVVGRKAELDKVNTYFTNINQYATRSGYPNNIFTELGYAPLTYNELVATS